MSIQIENGVFYVLDLGEEKFVFSTDDEAIAQLKVSAADLEDPEVAKLLMVDVKDEKWSISQVSWTKIAIKLLSQAE